MARGALICGKNVLGKGNETQLSKRKRCGRCGNDTAASVPYLLRRHCSRARAAAQPPPMSRPSPRRCAAAASRPVYATHQSEASSRFSHACGKSQRPQTRQAMLQDAAEARTQTAHAVWAHLIPRGGRFAVGVEQQLHHLGRRTLGGSVVQGQLFLLCVNESSVRRRTVHVLSSGASSLRGRARSNDRGKRRRRLGVYTIYSRMNSAARVILPSGGLGVGLDQQLHHLRSGALGSSDVQGLLPVLRSAP